MKFFKYWLPPILLAAGIFVVSGIPYLDFNLKDPFENLLRGVGHALAYLLLFFLLARAFDAGQKLYAPQLLLRAASLATLFALSDEIHQAFIPGRQGSGEDILVDGIGIFLGAIYFRLRYKW